MNLAVPTAQKPRKRPMDAQSTASSDAPSDRFLLALLDAMLELAPIPAGPAPRWTGPPKKPVSPRAKPCWRRPTACPTFWTPSANAPRKPPEQP